MFTEIELLNNYSTLHQVLVQSFHMKTSIENCILSYMTITSPDNPEQTLDPVFVITPVSRWNFLRIVGETIMAYKTKVFIFPRFIHWRESRSRKLQRVPVTMKPSCVADVLKLSKRIKMRHSGAVQKDALQRSTVGIGRMASEVFLSR